MDPIQWFVVLFVGMYLTSKIISWIAFRVWVWRYKRRLAKLDQEVTKQVRREYQCRAKLYLLQRRLDEIR